MTAICITPPTTLPVDLEVAKANMRVDGDGMDALITNWIKGIVAKLEHEIGQCLIEQTWRVTLDVFPVPDLHEAMCGSPRQCAPAISLPHPVGEILTVRYIDQAGDQQQLDPAA